MEENSIVIYGTPFGKQRPRVTQFGGFAHAYTPKETVNYEALIKHEYVQQSNKFYDSDLPLKLSIKAYFDIPKAFSKTKRQNAIDGQIRPMKKPDYDNIAKVVTDALNKVAFDDDKQIVEASIKKYYSERPRVEFFLEEVKW